jgi:hypothetical protein
VKNYRVPGTLVDFHTGGHFLQAQKPDEVAAELKSFFEGRRTRSFHIPHEAEEASPKPDAARGEL